MQPAEIAFIVVGVLVVLFVVLLFALSGGDTRRLSLAFRGFGKALRDPAFAAKVEPLLTPPPAPAGPPPPSGVPVRILALMQREGRLIDFLMENLHGASDAQIVAAVRDIHPQCQAALKKHLVLGPVIDQAEGSTIDVPAGFDPSAVRLVGNVTGQPP